MSASAVTSKHRKRVGVWAQHLASANPRGIGRVLRGVCEELRSDEDIEYLAITQIYFFSGTVTFETYPLAPFVAAGQRAGSRDELARMGLPARLMPSGEIHCLLSVECFEAIWDWPLRHLGIRSACFVHDLIPFRINEGSDEASKASYFKTLGRVVERADVLLCDSHSSAYDLEAVFPSAAAKSVVISLGSGRAIKDHERALERQAPKGFAPVASTVTLLMVGVVESRKNFQSVLAAAPAIAAALGARKLRLVIVGDVVGPGDIFRHVYNETLRRAQSAAEVIFTGYVNENALLEWYRAATVFVFPSFWEGFGLPILEALKLGVTVVASDIPCHREVGGNHIRYCDPFDVDDLAVKIIEAIELSPPQRAWELARARSWAAGFTWARTAQECHAVLAALAHDKGVEEAIQTLQQPGRRRTDLLSPPRFEVAEIGFLFPLADVLEGADLRVIVLMSLLRDNAASKSAGIALVLAVHPASLTQAGTDFILSTVRDLIDAAPHARLVALPIGGLATLTLEQMEILALIDSLAADRYESRDLSAADVLMLDQQRRPLRIERLYATDPSVVASLPTAALDVGKLIVVDQPKAHDPRTASTIGTPPNAAEPEVLDLPTIRCLAEESLAVPDTERIRSDTDVYNSGSLAAAIARLEQPGGDTRLVEASATELLRSCPALGGDIAVLVITRSRTEYRQARAVTAQQTSAVAIVLVEEGVIAASQNGSTASGAIPIVRHPTALRTLVLASRCVVARIIGNGHVPEELRFAAFSEKPAVAVGPTLDPLLTQVFGIESSPDFATAIPHACARVAKSRQGRPAPAFYPLGIEIVIAALHAVATDRAMTGIDPFSLGHLLASTDIQAFGARLEHAGIDGGSWKLLESAPVGAKASSGPPMRAVGTATIPLGRPPVLRRGAITRPMYQVTDLWTGKRRRASDAVAQADRARDDRDWPKASAHYKRALALRPDLAPIWVQYGHALKEQGKREEAERAYQKALALEPDNADTFLQLGHVLKLLGRDRGAEHAYFQALVLDPGFSFPRKELSQLGYSDGAIDFAVGARRRAAA